VNIGLIVLMREDEKLSDDKISNDVVNSRAEDDDSVLKKAGVDIHRPFFTTTSLNNDRN
jgi:hypothetical protein